MGEEIDVESRTITMHLETRGSRKALGAINAKLRAKAGRLERDLSVALAKVEELEARVEQLSLPYTKMCEQVWELQEQRDSFQRVGISALEQRDQLAAHLSFAVTMISMAGLGGNAQVDAMHAALSDLQPPVHSGS